MLKQKKVLLTGGGTGGSVTPLLAIAEELRLKSQPGDYNFLWIGTKNGIEQSIVEKEGIIFRAIHAGKLRRYFSWQNFIDPFLIIAGIFESFSIIIKWKPDLIISAGSFVALPVILAGWLLRIPILVHQLDIEPGLSNKLAAPFASAISVSFKESLPFFRKKTYLTGNPIRPRLYKLYFEHLAKINTNEDSLPILLVLGGGTGAQFINELVEKSLNELIGFCEVIHITGRNKMNSIKPSDNYQSYDFLNQDELAWAYSAADLVVSRAGIGTLTELSHLEKPTIIIPMPDSHQEKNAQIFHEAQAAVILRQSELTPGLFAKFIKKILADPPLTKELSENIGKMTNKEAGKFIIEIVDKLLKN